MSKNMKDVHPSVTFCANLTDLERSLYYKGCGVVTIAVDANLTIVDAAYHEIGSIDDGVISYEAKPDRQVQGGVKTMKGMFSCGQFVQVEGQ